MDPSTFTVKILRNAVRALVKQSNEEPENVIKDDETTNSLCSAIEAIFLNGQNELGYKKMLTRFGFGSTRHPYECCFWEYLQYYLPKQLTDMIVHSRIQEKRTPIGCCRVWVRVALNEATICNFLESMRYDTERTNRFYKPSALLRDSDRMEASMGLLRTAISQCTFDLDYMGWELNSWNMSTALSLANVHYVVPTVTPLRPYSISDASRSINTRRSSDEFPSRSISLSDPVREAVEDENPADSRDAPVVTETAVDPRWRNSPATLENVSEEEEKPLTNLGPASHEEDVAVVEVLEVDSVDAADLTTAMDSPSDRAWHENPIQPSTVGECRNSTPSASTTSSFTPSATSFPLPSRHNDQPLSAMQVADELPASPRAYPAVPVPVAAMSPEAVMAEAVRRGLLLSPPELPISETYLETLVHAVEEHRRREREEALEAILEKPRGFVRTTPPLSADGTSLSSWDRNLGNSSSTPLSASDVAPASASPPVLLDPEEVAPVNEEDEFTVFPRRRPRLESSGDHTSSLAASTSVPNLAGDLAARSSELERLAFAAETMSLSTSWDRPERAAALGGAGRRSDLNRDRSSSVTIHCPTTPQSEGILDRIASNLPGRRASGSLMSRISTGLWNSAARLRGSYSSSERRQSDDEWEIVGDEFIASKNARCKRLLDIHPGAERVPDPQHDFADTNCARCRGHIIGRLRKLDHYDGRWYCSSCHEGALCILPRRVLFHWDFAPMPVSNETKVILTRLFLQPNIDIMKTNPELYTKCPELREVTRVRRQLAFLWQYVVDCSSGVGRDMNRMLIPRERLIGTIPEIHLYSLEDLSLTHRGGALLKLVHHVLKIGLTHVWSCSECQTSRPHFCDRCGERIPLYELDIYHKCITATCDAVVHKRCFSQHPEDFMCLVCTRKKENKVPLHESYDAVFVDSL